MDEDSPLHRNLHGEDSENKPPPAKDSSDSLAQENNDLTDIDGMIDHELLHSARNIAESDSLHSMTFWFDTEAPSLPPAAPTVAVVSKPCEWVPGKPKVLPDKYI
jgi:hypothetical protein